MTTTYRIDYAHGLSEVDDYEKGCIGPSVHRTFGIDISRPTPAEAVAAFCEFFGVDVKDAELDACEEPGRIDIGIMEDDDGNQAEPDDAWKRGERRLWYVVWTGYVEKVKTEPARLT